MSQRIRTIPETSPEGTSTGGLENQGDRRGSNPRRPEPQSSGRIAVSSTCTDSRPVKARKKTPGIASSRTGSGKDESESSILKRVTEALWAFGGVHVMRNNVGAGKKKGFYVRYGLEVGSADLVCIVAPYGRWLCIETKRAKGGKESEEQARWLQKMRNYGAVAGFVRSPEEALALLVEARKPAFT